MGLKVTSGPRPQWHFFRIPVTPLDFCMFLNTAFFLHPQLWVNVPFPLSSRPIKRQRRSRNIELAEVDAEGDIFDDPCRPCRLKRISCVVSPRSTRCVTCVRAGHTCSSTFSIQLLRSHDSLPAVQARIASAETDLGRSIEILTESLSKVEDAAEISKLQVELDILRRRRIQMQPAEYSPSSSPRGASSSLAFSEIPSVSSALDADVVSLEDDDTESSRSSSPHPSSPAFPEVSSAPSALGADVVSLENGNTDKSTAVVTGSFDLSGEVPASLPSVLATGVAQSYHLDLSDRFLGVPDNSFTRPPVRGGSCDIC
jgi:hypothetical protein